MHDWRGGSGGGGLKGSRLQQWFQHDEYLSYLDQGVQMVLVVNFVIIIFCFFVDICDPVHSVEAWLVG